MRFSMVFPRKLGCLLAGLSSGSSLSPSLTGRNNVYGGRYLQQEPSKYVYIFVSVMTGEVVRHTYATVNEKPIRQSKRCEEVIGIWQQPAAGGPWRLHMRSRQPNKFQQPSGCYRNSICNPPPKKKIALLIIAGVWIINAIMRSISGAQLFGFRISLGWE